MRRDEVDISGKGTDDKQGRKKKERTTKDRWENACRRDMNTVGIKQSR